MAQKWFNSLDWHSTCRWDSHIWWKMDCSRIPIIFYKSTIFEWNTALHPISYITITIVSDKWQLAPRRHICEILVIRVTGSSGNIYVAICSYCASFWGVRLLYISLFPSRIFESVSSNSGYFLTSSWYLDTLWLLYRIWSLVRCKYSKNIFSSSVRSFWAKVLR